MRELTRKEVPWNWSNEREVTFQNVKKRLMEAPTLAYFDTNNEVVLQVDSSKKESVPFCYKTYAELASHALRQSERNWAQIEKEAPSMLYGLERLAAK